MGVKVAGVALPDDERGRSWWEQLGIDLRDIQKGCNLLAEVYENPTLPRQGQKDTYTRNDDISIFDKTRSAVTPLPSRSPTASAGSGSQGTKRERDDANSGEWGSTAPNNTEYREPPTRVDDLQKRIDDIVNAAAPAAPVQEAAPASANNDIDDDAEKVDYGSEEGEL